MNSLDTKHKTQQFFLQKLFVIYFALTFEVNMIVSNVRK